MNLDRTSILKAGDGLFQGPPGLDRPKPQAAPFDLPARLIANVIVSGDEPAQFVLMFSQLMGEQARQYVLDAINEKGGA